MKFVSSFRNFIQNAEKSVTREVMKKCCKSVFSRFTALFSNNCSGGQGGIRTLDTLLTYTRVPADRTAFRLFSGNSFYFSVFRFSVKKTKTNRKTSVFYVCCCRRLRRHGDSTSSSSTLLRSDLSPCAALMVAIVSKSLSVLLKFMSLSAFLTRRVTKSLSVLPFPSRNG